jgi:hypothetical protein
MSIEKLGEVKRTLKEKPERSESRLDAVQLAAALREFLTSYPLYRKQRLGLSGSLEGLAFPASISGPCSNPMCKGEPSTTWKQLSASDDCWPARHLLFRCVHCDISSQAFWILIEAQERVEYDHPVPFRQAPLYKAFTIQKIGQSPPWSITVPREIERALGEDGLELYRNGLVSMSQSYGLGALAYFRRVIENTVGDLLNLVEEAAEADRNPAALEAVQGARATKRADEKLRLIQDVIPVSLRPGGVNPFGKLYDDYSRGLHALSDEECLSIATELRDTLEYVFGNIRDQLDRAKAYRARITGGRA